ncbi:hypothetical protein [Priestia endophytica]|uniref:Lipoprotein n=1 Tax=Priestia endophytica TaxID=135735 RepID=A0AAX1Q9A0_9BACI|nr:hypothetical protein [Priestia endophytica]RAS76669.1 hypothetical protein A3864_12665 [Priestia endophytica]
MFKQLLIILVALCLIAGCQQKSNQTLPGINQLKEVKEIQISEFKELGSLNENFKEKFTKKDQLEVFKKALKSAKRQDEPIKIYDYDMKLNFTNGEDKALHIAKNKKNEIILKYIGDSNATFAINNEKSKDLIKLINLK